MKGNEEKNRFRSSNEWKVFRKKLIQERGTYCQCCGKKTYFLDCHHADEANYKDLNPDKFFLVCKMCHRCISALEQIKPENWYKIRNPEWVDLYSRFLIVEPQK